MCPFEKGFILDDDDRCICPAERGFYVDENGNCARCPVELGFVLTEDGLCICDPEKGYVLTRAGTCDCPLPAEKDEDGDCVGAWSPRGRLISSVMTRYFFFLYIYVLYFSCAREPPI